MNTSRRNIFRSLLGLGGLTTHAQAKQLRPEDKVDLGIPLRVDTSTPLSEDMVVMECINGVEERVVEPVIAVDVVKGEIAYLSYKEVPDHAAKDFFGHKRTKLISLPPVVRSGDFRVRWRKST